LFCFSVENQQFMRDCHIRQCKKPYQSGAFTNLKQMPFGFIHSRMNKKNDFLKKNTLFV